jgi:hypothetical protein
MKTYHNADQSKRLFYDPSIKSWTMLSLDTEGNQVGSADYCHNRSHAFEWLNS